VTVYRLWIANRNYSSWSLRPWLLMKALDVPFEERLTVFSEGSNREAFRAFSPSGTVPCLVDDDRAVWDSLAIVEYLHERHAGVWPEDDGARAWARCAAAEMHAGFPALRAQCPMNCGVRVRLAAVSGALAQDIARVDELWSEGQKRFGGPFLAGARFTAVDAFFAPVAFRVQTYAISLGEVAERYAGRLLALPAMQAWYEAALAEPWREVAHEAETRAAGTWVADLRT
jgi:glutathione S-transferase